MHLIQGFGSLHASMHVQPCGLNDLKGDVEAQLVEEVSHLLAEPVGSLQAWLWHPVDRHNTFTCCKKQAQTLAKPQHLKQATLRNVIFSSESGTLPAQQKLSSQLYISNGPPTALPEPLQGNARTAKDRGHA